MTKLLELRERIRDFYGKYEIYIKPVTRFIIALTAFLMINGNIGYMSRLKNPVVAIVLALPCTFLPINATVVLGAVLILAHLFALSLETCVIALLLFLLMFFMYYKYAPKNGYTTVLTPVLCRFGIGEAMPTVVGLGKEPYSVLSVVCGLVVYYYLKGIHVHETVFSAAAEEKGKVSKFTLALQQIVGNKELYVVAAAFVVTTLLIYVIRRRPINHAWSIAVGVGNGVNLVILLVGSFWAETTANIPGFLIGTVLAVVVGLGMEFFLFHLDYARTEQVQFEDDEYYYYVKAVPKVTVSGKEKQVKQINSRKDARISKKELADEFEIDQELLDD